MARLPLATGQPTPGYPPPVDPDADDMPNAEEFIQGQLGPVQEFTSETVALPPPAAPPNLTAPPRHPRMSISRGLPNALGVTYDHTTDDCYYLNASWKKGCCMRQGNEPCRFLGGNQGVCDIYESIESVDGRQGHLPRKFRRFGE